VNVELLTYGWQPLNKDAASGVDGLTAEIYAANLEGNIADLAGRVKAGRYRAKYVRRVYISKENGKERPLGIPAL
jgi:retron-type reverse transcriptase